jgi:hypothetical protein
MKARRGVSQGRGQKMGEGNRKDDAVSKKHLTKESQNITNPEFKRNMKTNSGVAYEMPSLW